MNAINARRRPLRREAGGGRSSGEFDEAGDAEGDHRRHEYDGGPGVGAPPLVVERVRPQPVPVEELADGDPGVRGRLRRVRALVDDRSQPGPHVGARAAFRPEVGAGLIEGVHRDELGARDHDLAVRDGMAGVFDHGDDRVAFEVRDIAREDDDLSVTDSHEEVGRVEGDGFVGMAGNTHAGSWGGQQR